MNKQITSQQLSDALEKQGALTGDPGTCFVCEDMPVFKLDDKGRLMQACTRASHGIHKRFERANRAMMKIVAVVGGGDSDVCPDCGGKGWFEYDDPSAIRNRVLSKVCGIFRGVQLPSHDKMLTADRLRATLGSYCMDSLPSESVTDQTPGPAGKGDPGRAVLSNKQ